MSALREEIKERLNKLVSREKKKIFSSWRWTNFAMMYLWRRPELRSQVFQFVDVLPRLKDTADIYLHWKEYLAKDSSVSIPPRVVGFCDRSPSAQALIALAARAWVRVMAHHFIVEEKPEAIRKVIRELSCSGATHSFDVLGEQVVSEWEADGYMRKYCNLISFLRREREPRDLSIKFSSLYSQFDPLREESSCRAILKRLRKIVNAMGGCGGRITVDMEQFYFRNLTWGILKKVVVSAGLPDACEWGTAHQAYLRDSEEFLKNIIAFAKEYGISLTVRIVKGAYWDYEVCTAQQRNWPIPVYERIEETHASFERNVDIALANYPTIKTAIGSHNLSSIAYAIAKQQGLGLPREALEIQVLYGLGTPLIRPLAELGYPVRVYVGIGDLLGGMAFSTRRLLENTSQASSAFFAPAKGVRG